MKRMLIGCSIIKKELQNLLAEKHKDIDVIWMDEDLHNHPEKLREELQKTIDSIEGYDEIILSYGLCGNALIGITAKHCDIIYLATNDCINALLCDNCRLQELRRDSVFVSKGWLSTKNNFNAEYARTVEKYGEKRAQIIYKMLYEHYKNVIYMKTEDVIDEEMINAAHNMADTLDLSLLIEPANINLYEKLLTCKEDNEKIKRLKKGETIKYNDFIKILEV